MPVTFPVKLPTNPVFAVIVVPVITVADVTPIVVASIAPPFISTVVNVLVPTDVISPRIIEENVFDYMEIESYLLKHGF